MISDYEIVAIEYKGGIPEYDSELKIQKLLKKLSLNFDEVFILKTPQNLSIYACTNAFFHLQNFLLKEGIRESAEYFLNTKSTTQHLFEVASGIKTNILGESDILSIIDYHFKQAKNHGTVGPFLSELINRSIECGKSIQKRTSTSNIKNSFRSAGLDFIYDQYQSFNLRILVVGSAELAESILKFFKNKEVEKVYVANHRFEDAKRLAKLYQASPVKGDDLSPLFPELDVVFVCGQKDKLLNAIYEHQEKEAENGSENNNPVFIDYDSINTGSNFAKADKTISKDYFDQYAVGPAGHLQDSDIISANVMIEECVEEFHKRVKQMKLAPTLNEFVQKIKKIEGHELATLFSKLDSPSQETRATIKKYSSNLLKKITEGPFSYINELAEDPLKNQETLRAIHEFLNRSKDS